MEASNPRAEAIERRERLDEIERAIERAIEHGAAPDDVRETVAEALEALKR